MRVALVHDYLNQYGGGERVLEVLMEIFPDAPVYTLLHDKERTQNRFQGRVAKTSFLDFSFVCRNHRQFIPLMPVAANFLDLGDEYDLVISDTAGFAKGIRYGEKTKHLSYIHTPLRYAWEQEEYLLPIMDKASFLMAKPILHYLKYWDFKMGQKPDALIANSNFIAGKIKNYYKRDSQIIYPPVDKKKFYLEKESKSKNYYLAVGRMLHYKKFDLIVDVFSELGMPVKIVGDGAELESLRDEAVKRQASNIEFLQNVSDDGLRGLYNEARALIFPQVEDFGLVAAEAQMCGLPVIAFAAGGALEIINDGKTGVLFAEQTAKSLAGALQKFKSMKFNRRTISRQAQKFSKENFKKGILTAAKSLA